MPLLLSLLAAAILEVPAGGDLAGALARARPGDVLVLGPGRHAGALGALGGVTVHGAGAGSTEVIAPEGEDGARVEAGEGSLADLTLVAGEARCALRVRGGTAHLEGVVLAGGACGARVEGGALAGREVELLGARGLDVAGGRVDLEGGAARGTQAAVQVGGGEVTLRRLVVAGPAREAALVAAGGRTRLEVVTILAPGALGLSAAPGARVDAFELTVVGGSADPDAIPGACVLSRRASVTLSGGLLARCGGSALEALGGEVRAGGVDAVGGLSGCLLFLGGARGALAGNLCAGQGPGVLVTGGATVDARLDRWLTDPIRWVDCASGARMTLGPGEPGPVPCTARSR